MCIRDRAKAEEQLQKLVNSKPVEAVRNTANEVLDMIKAVVGRKGRLDIPVVGSKYLKKISQRLSLIHILSRLSKVSKQ